MVQAALKLGLSGRYMNASVRSLLQAEASLAQRTVTAYFVQKMFTASVVLPASPAEFFSAEFTEADLEAHIAAGRIGPNNVPVYVANIVYGRILKFSVTSREAFARIRAALSASYGSLAEGSIDASLLAILKTSEINVVTVGGEGRNAIELIQNGRLRDYFGGDAALTSARPIAYTIRNLGDNSIARVSETTSYNINECDALPAKGWLRIDLAPNDASFRVRGAGGLDTGPLLGDATMELDPGGYTVTAFRDNGAGQPDTSFTQDTLEVDVIAGDTTAGVFNVRDRSVLGERYRITLDGITVTDAGCAQQLGEGDPDLYYDFFLLRDDSTELQFSLAESNSVTRAVGSRLNFGGAVSARSVERDATLSRQPGLQVRSTVWDDDTFTDDKMADGTLIFDYPNVPVGQVTKAIGGVASCRVELHMTIESLQTLP